MVQIIENRADLSGTVQSSERNGAVLHVLVDNVAAVEGFPSLADDAVGEAVVVNVPESDARAVQPGARIRCRVRKTGVDRYAALPGEVRVDG